jgi:hypothetical protein
MTVNADSPVSMIQPWVDRLIAISDCACKNWPHAPLPLHPSRHVGRYGDRVYLAL